MKFENLPLLIVSLLFRFSSISAQTTFEFPESWQGKWKGEMEIFAGGKLAQKLPMQLHILPTDSAGIFTYRIVYGTDTLAGDRPYLIRAIDKAKGKFVIDEQNSIKIEAYLLGNSLTSAYEVEGNFIFDILEKRGDTLFWRLFSSKTLATSITGDKMQGEEKIPPVKAFPIGVLQQAELKR